MRAAVLLLAATVAHAETRPHYGGTVEATLLGAPVTLDPPAARSHAELTAVQLLYDTLYAIGPDGIAQPHVAVDTPVLDEKRTTARIAIRKGIRFHDGSALTAQDVVASLERARAIAGWPLAAVQTVRVDGDAVLLELRAPVPELATLLALPQLAIAKPGKASAPVGSGPFTVEAWDRRHLQLRAFDDHFAGRPYVDQLVLRWYDTPDGEARKFETGSAHVSARGVAAFAGGQSTYKADDVEGPAALLVFVGFGKAHADALRDPAFRRAVDHVITRSGLASIGSGERVVPTRSPVPVEAGGTMLDAADRAGDLGVAQLELADAAKRIPNVGKLHLEILVEDTRPDDREVAERVVLALGKLGIVASLQAVPAAVLRDRVAKGECDLWIGQLAEPVTAQPAWWAAAFAAGGDDWALPQLQQGALDPAAAAKAFADRVPMIPLMFRAVRLWHRTDLHGVTFDASGRPCYADVFVFGTPTKAKPP